MAFDRKAYMREYAKNRIKPIPATWVKIPCNICEKPFVAEAYYVKIGRKKYCSKQCLGIANGLRRLGKGTKLKQNTLDRSKFGRIRHLIYERDDYTCQICNKRGGNLHVDHIKKFADNPELRFEANNCRTVCVPCHYYITFKRKMPSNCSWGVRKSIQCQQT